MTFGKGQRVRCKAGHLMAGDTYTVVGAWERGGTLWLTLESAPGWTTVMPAWKLEAAT